MQFIWLTNKFHWPSPSSILQSHTKTYIIATRSAEDRRLKTAKNSQRSKASNTVLITYSRAVREKEFVRGLEPCIAATATTGNSYKLIKFFKIRCSWDQKILSSTYNGTVNIPREIGWDVLAASWSLMLKWCSMKTKWVDVQKTRLDDSDRSCPSACFKFCLQSSMMKSVCRFLASCWKPFLWEVMLLIFINTDKPRRHSAEWDA